MKNKFEVIIIGAGSIGNPSAYFLAKMGKKVFCIDKFASSGQGQNKAAIGGVRATHSDPAKIKLCQQSLKIFGSWEQEHGYSIGFKKGGYCFPVYREQDENVLKSLMSIQKKYNLNINFETPERIKEIIPGINPEGLRGGTYSPDDAQVSTLLASESFYEESRKLGAVFHFNENFTEFIKDKNRIIGIKTDKGEYFADNFLIASGADAEDTCKKAGLNIPIKPDSHEAGITSAVKQFLGPLVVDMRPGADGRTANFYFGQTHSGQIIFCYTPKPIIPGENRFSTSDFMPIIARRMVDLIPRFRNLLIRRIWRGLYPMTPDGVAVVGKHSAVENVYLGVGMCGQGFMLGPGVGINLANLIVQGKPLLEPEVFNLLSPERNFFAGKEEKLK